MRILASMALMTIGLAVPATAQWTGIRGPVSAPAEVGGVGRELGSIRDDIADGKRSGQLSRREARSLRRSDRAIGVLQDRFASDGLSSGEQWELDGRARALGDQVGNARIIKRK